MSESRYEQLVRWRDDARRELEALQVNLIELQKRAEEAKTRLSLMDRLLALEQDGLAAEQPASMAGDLLDVCEVILRNAGEPLHIGEEAETPA